MEQRETIAPGNQLTAVLDEMRRPNPDVGRLGEALFDLSGALIPTLKNYIDRDRQAWRRQTGGGINSEGLVGQVEQYQLAFSTLASLGKPDKPIDYLFYLPDSGYSRLAFAKNEQGDMVVEVSYNSTPEVKKGFKQLSGGKERLELTASPVSPAPSGLRERWRKLWRR